MKKLILILCCCIFQCEPTDFFVIRHGETDWNREGIIQGQTDIPLNSKGIAQAEESAQKIACRYTNIDAVYGSDLLRASQTAEIIAKTIGTPVFTTPLLREVCQGEAEGMTWSVIKEKYGRVSSPKWTLLEIPGGETYPEILARIRSAFSDIYQKYPKGRVVIVAHRLLIKLLSAELLDPYSTIDLCNCELLPILYEEKNGRPLITIGDKENLCFDAAKNTFDLPEKSDNPFEAKTL